MKGCNILIDELPHEVVVDGVVYPINYGYRAQMLIEIAMFSDRDDEQKVLDSLNIFYFSNIPENMDAAMEQLLLFHRCGVASKAEGSAAGRPAAQPRKKMRAYCFDQDAPLIYAAFRTQYNLNLNRTKNNELHWWEFMAMFDSLAEDLLISRVMFYRTADLTGMGKNQKEFIKKMRSIYALKHVDSDLDARAKLAKRNQDMKEYVRKRMEDAQREGGGNWQTMVL